MPPLSYGKNPPPRCGNLSIGLWQPLFRFVETSLSLCGNPYIALYKSFYRFVKTPLRLCGNPSIIRWKRLYRIVENLLYRFAETPLSLGRNASIALWKPPLSLCGKPSLSRLGQVSPQGFICKNNIVGDSEHIRGNGGEGVDPTADCSAPAFDIYQG